MATIKTLNPCYWSYPNHDLASEQYDRIIETAKTWISSKHQENNLRWLHLLWKHVEILTNKGKSLPESADWPWNLPRYARVLLLQKRLIRWVILLLPFSALKSFSKFSRFSLLAFRSSSDFLCLLSDPLSRLAHSGFPLPSVTLSSYSLPCGCSSSLFLPFSPNLAHHSCGFLSLISPPNSNLTRR